MIRELLDLIVPRFVTRDMAVNRAYCPDCDEYHWEPVCDLPDVEPREHFDGIATFRYFAFLWWALFVRQVSEVRPFVNPHDARKA